MIILVTFALLAGMATIIAPCVLPILPVVLSVGTTGGRKRPLGIVSGLIVSFSFATLALTSLVSHLGFNPDNMRIIAATLLILFGLIMILPQLKNQFELLISRFLPQMSANHGEGFWSGFFVGLNLGIIWTPCSGPIMVSVITLAATSGVTLTAVFVTIAFSFGAAIPLLAFLYFGKKVHGRISARSSVTIERVFGLIMILTAAAIMSGFDRTLQASALDRFPKWGNALLHIERNNDVERELYRLQ